MEPLPGARTATIIVAGDVCEDVLIIGPSQRLSRETPGLPIIDVAESLTVDGGAAVAYRQANALEAGAYLVPTGRPATKTRLFAADRDVSREVARWDQPWPPQDTPTFLELMRHEFVRDAETLLYSQVRPGSPSTGILKACRKFKGLKVADGHHPAYFAGFDMLKIGMDAAWEALRKPRPPKIPAQGLEVAESFLTTYGYDMVVLTMGGDGYAAVVAGDSGSVRLREDSEPGFFKARRTAGAGDIFSATLAVGLTVKMEIRDALRLANRAAGLACSKDLHLGTVRRDELR